MIIANWKMNGTSENVRTWNEQVSNNIDVKPETVTTENLAPVVEVTEKETPKTEAASEAAPEVKEKKEETKSKNISEKK